MPDPARTQPLLLVHGDDRHRVDEEVRLWREAAAGAQLGVEVFDPPAPLDRLRSALAEIPLIDERRYVLVRDPPAMGGGRRAGGSERELAEALELRAPSTSVCLVGHQQLPAAHPVVAAVHRLGGEVRLRNPLRGRELRGWVEQAAASRGLRLPPAALEHLLRVAGSDLGTVVGELEKLSAYQAGTAAPGRGPQPGPTGRARPAVAAVDLELVRALVAGSEGVEVWGVLERLLGPEPAEGAAAALELTEQGRSAVYLIATLAGQLSELRRAQVLLAGGGSAARIAGELGIPDWRAERLARQARTVAPEVVEGWLHQLRAIDVAIKAGETDDRQAMGRFGLGAARVVARGRAHRGAAGGVLTDSRQS